MFIQFVLGKIFKRNMFSIQVWAPDWNTHKKVLCIFFLIFSSSDSDSDDGEDQKGEKENAEKKVENANKDEAIEWLDHRACQPFR